MTNVLVHPGICRFDTVIKAVKHSDVVKLQIVSECECIKKLAKTLTEFSIQDWRESKSLTDNKIYKSASNCILHFSCPIPCTIIKVIEVELDLALKKDVTIKFLN